MINTKVFCKLIKFYSVTVQSRINNLSMNIVNIKNSVHQEHIDSAVNSLLDGFVIALPTDTIYGLACLTQNDKAIQNIYKIKKRRTDKPLAICVSEIEDIYTWGKVTVSDDLLNSLLPGPVTLIFERTEALNSCLNPDNNLVGIRIPDHTFIRNVVSKCGSPIALTSANITSEKSPLEIGEFDELWDKLDKVFDGGSLGGSAHCRKGSTIIDLSIFGFYKVVRKGSAYLNTSKILQKFGLKRISA